MNLHKHHNKAKWQPSTNKHITSEMPTKQLLSLLIYECNTDRLIAVLMCRGIVGLCGLSLSFSTAVTPFFNLFSLCARYIFSQFPFLFSALSVSNSLNHCLLIALSYALHLCSVSFSILNLSSPSFCPSLYFWSVCSPLFTCPLWVVCSLFEGIE